MSGPRSTHDVLLSIEERLKALDTFGYAIRLSNLDHGLEQLTRRLGDIEGKLDRLESKLDIRMEKIHELVLGKDLKEGVSVDQILRRVESLNEKVGSKLGLGEVRMALGMENLGLKVERAERHVRGGVDDLLDKLVKSDERRAHFETQALMQLDRIQSTASHVQHVRNFLKEDLTTLVHGKFQELGDKVDLLRTTTADDGRCEGLEATVRDWIMGSNWCPSTSSSTTESSDTQLESAQDGVVVGHLRNISAMLSINTQSHDKRLQKVETDVETYGRKVLSMSQEVLRETKSMAAFLSEALDSSNQTRNIFRDGFRKLHQQMKPVSGLDEPLEAVRKKVSDLTDTVDTSFASLLVAQNTFINSCHRIQQQEPEIEIKIYNVLQKIVQDLHSRTDTTEASTKTLQSSFESHTRNLGRALNDLVWTVITVGNETSQDVRRLGDRLVARGIWPMSDRITLANLCQSVYYATLNSSNESKSDGGNVASDEDTAVLGEADGDGDADGEDVTLSPTENIKDDSTAFNFPSLSGQNVSTEFEKVLNVNDSADFDYSEYYVD